MYVNIINKIVLNVLFWLVVWKYWICLDEFDDNKKKIKFGLIEIENKMFNDIFGKMDNM